MADYNNQNYWTDPENFNPDAFQSRNVSGYQQYPPEHQPQPAYQLPSDHTYLQNEPSGHHPFQIGQAAYDFGLEQPIYNELSGMTLQSGALPVAAEAFGQDTSGHGHPARYVQAYGGLPGGYAPYNSYQQSTPMTFGEPVNHQLPDSSSHQSQIHPDRWPGQDLHKFTQSDEPMFSYHEPTPPNRSLTAVTNSDQVSGVAADSAVRGHPGETPEADNSDISPDAVAVSDPSGTASTVSTSVIPPPAVPGRQMYNASPRILGEVVINQMKTVTGAEHLFLGAPREFEKLGNLREANASIKHPLAARFRLPNSRHRLPVVILADYAEHIMVRHRREALTKELEKSVKSTGASFDPYEQRLSKMNMNKRIEKRPVDEVDAAAFEAASIADLDGYNKQHSDPKEQRTVADAVGAFGKLVRKPSEAIYNRMKKFDEAKAAEDADTPLLKEDDPEYAHLAEILLSMLEAAEEFGSREVLRNLGGNKKLVQDLVVALKRHATLQGSDLAGAFPKGILRLMQHFKTVEYRVLEILKFQVIQRKYVAKGDEEVTEMMKKIVRQAKGGVDGKVNKAASDTPASTPEPSPSSTLQAKTAEKRRMAPAEPAKKNIGVSTAKMPSDPSTSKRPRDDEPDIRAAKKLHAEPAAAAAPSALTKPPTAKAASNLPATTSAPGKPWSGTALLPGKARPVVKPPVKPAASKAEVPAPRPATTAATENVKPTQVRSEGTKATAPKFALTKASKVKPTKSDSSVTKLGALLEEIAQPKRAPQPVTTPESSNEIVETPAEKERRLRKEKRRKLRVTWKEGDALTEVRVFQKDVDEDEGRDSNMVQDASKHELEGMALRRGLEQGDKLGEEEEDELPYRPWFEPSAIDFSPIPDEQRAKSFVTRGGAITFSTEQQKFIAERENREIMVVYTRPSDIPPTPKSPPPLQSQEYIPAAPQGIALPSNTPQLEEVHRRWREMDQMGISWATHNALDRVQLKSSGSAGQTSPANIDPKLALESLRSMAASQQQADSSSRAGSSLQQGQHPHMSSASRDDQVLSLLTSSRVTNWRDPDPYDPTRPKTHRRYDYPNPEVQKAADAVENVAEALKGNPFPATEPPEWMRNDATRVAEWWHGYHKDKQRDATRLQENASHNMTQTHSQAVPNGGAQPAQDASTAALMAYWAQYSQARANQQTAYNQYYSNTNVQPQIPQQAAYSQASPDANSQLQALLATLGSTPQAAAQPSVAPGPASTDANSQLQALLASMSGASQSAQPSQAAPGPNGLTPNDPNYQALLLSLAQSTAPQTQGSARQHTGAAAHPQTHEQHSRQHKGHGSGQRSGGRSYGDKDKSSSSSIPPHLRGINREKIGTKPCVFWQNGTCTKGDKCTFRHD